MKQEHRLVAEIYRFLAPFVDTSKPIYLSLDGQAAQIGVRNKLFTDPTVPDLWFSFINEPNHTLIEAKIVDDNRVLLMKSQIRAWCSDGSGAHKPNFWVAASRSFQVFYFWKHSDFVHYLDATKSNTATTKIRLPARFLEFKSIAAVAHHIIRES